jgi:two-component system response regulator RegA
MANTPRRFLVVEDDAVLSRVLTRTLRTRGFSVEIATGPSDALASAAILPPDYVVLDLKLGNESSLPLIRPLREINPAMRICLLTGFANIATAVEATKLGAHYYLAKPAHVDEILGRLGIESQQNGTDVTPVPHSLDEVEWRHIRHVLRECGGNVSKAARVLNMHRRSLQRKIAAQESGEVAAMLGKLRCREERLALQRKPASFIAASVAHTAEEDAAPAPPAV